MAKTLLQEQWEELDAQRKAATDPLEQLRLEAELGRAERRWGKVPVAIERLESAVGQLPAGEEATAVEVKLRLNLVDCYVRIARYDDAKEQLGLVSTLLQRGKHDPADQAHYFLGRGHTHAFQGEFAECVREYERSFALYQAQGVEAGMAYTSLMIGIAQQDLGNLIKATAQFNSALKYAKSAQQPRLEAMIHSNLAALQIDLGQASRAEEGARRAIELQTRIGDERSRVIATLSHASALVQLERLLEALDELMELRETFSGGLDDYLGPFVGVMIAETQVRIGLTDDAAEELAAIERFTNEELKSRRLKVLALLRHVEGDWDAAQTAFGAAIEQARAIKNPLREVEILREWSVAARERGQVDLAQQHARSAIEIAKRLKVGQLAAQLERELLRT